MVGASAERLEEDADYLDGDALVLIIVGRQVTSPYPVLQLIDKLQRLHGNNLDQLVRESLSLPEVSRTYPQGGDSDIALHPGLPCCVEAPGIEECHHGNLAALATGSN